MEADFEQLPTVWRTKLRSTVPGVDHGAQVQHCLDRQLVGIGWCIDELPADPLLDDVCDWIAGRTWEGWGHRAASTVRRLGEQATTGDYVWTRDTSGRYLLSKIRGPYRYDNSEEAKQVDVHQVRDVDWAPRPLRDLEVPGAVIRSFIGTGSSFNRVHDRTARLLTHYLWAVLHKMTPPELEISRADVLQTILDPYDVEDLVYVWLQVERGYIALPRARMRDTPAYEWTMIHRESRRRSIVQIKTGQSRVDLRALADARIDRQTDTYAFAACGEYDGDPSLVTEVIGSRALLDFAASNPDLLAERTRSLFDLARY